MRYSLVTLPLPSSFLGAVARTYGDVQMAQAMQRRRIVHGDAERAGRWYHGVFLKHKNWYQSWERGVSIGNGVKQSTGETYNNSGHKCPISLRAGRAQHTAHLRNELSRTSRSMRAQLSIRASTSSANISSSLAAGSV